MPLQLKTFDRGGIHPVYNKFSAQKSIEYGDVAEKLIIAVNQHIGAPLEVVVKKGEDVQRGQLLAKSTGFVSSNVHAPVNGRIEKITNFPQLGGQIGSALILKAETPGQNLQEILQAEKPFNIDIENLRAEHVLQKVNEAGLVGMGGAGFPTHVKLSPPKDKPIDHLLINGAECEPLLQKDREAMQRDHETMFRGLEAMKQVTGATRVTIAVKRKNADVIEMIRGRAAGAGYELFVYEDVYPAGDEYVLVHAVTGRQIPPGGLPLHVDCVVDNVETIINIGHAVEGAPATEKYLTITGAVANPHTTLVPVGTSMAECLAAAGGSTVDDPTILIKAKFFAIYVFEILATLDAASFSML